MGFFDPFGGFQGEQGYTPQKGVDYWTAEDIAEINAASKSFAAEEVAKVVAGAPEEFDTLKEMSDRLLEHDQHIIELLKAQDELPQTLLNDRLNSGLYSPIEPVYTMNGSGCTFNSDGTITIAAGGYYFPVYPSVESAKGDVLVRFNKDFARTVEIAPNPVSYGGGSQPYIPTINYDGYAQIIIKKSDWDTKYPYMTLRFDNRNKTDAITVGNISVGDSVLNLTQNAAIVYVSTNGNNSGDGTATQPLATVNAALCRGAHSILIESGVYNQRINLSLARVGTVTIRNASVNGRVIFTNLDSILATTETPVTDHPTIFSAPCAYAFAATYRFIWVDGISDTATLITDSKRHPLERGKEYRCEDTRLTRCAATTLSAALTEIESASDYRWFYDSDAHLVYFSRPTSISAEHPLRFSTGDSLFQDNSKRTSVIISGIETKYIKFNLTDIAQAYAADCRAANVYGAGCFTYDHTRSITFLRCEATNGQFGSNGDGFNAHSLFSGDAFAKQTTVTLIDCWSHDNKDDGYSDHERSETTIIGGLYEYNGKGGVTPAYGSHCTCYDVYSRNNYAGFYYTGTAEQTEGGKYGQMLCISCVAESNRGGGQPTGFVVDGTGNTGKCVSCKSIDNGTGYRADTGCTLELIDCGAAGNTTVKSGSVVINNTTLVT